MHSIFANNEAEVRRRAVGLAREKHKAELQQWLNAQMQNQVYVEDDKFSFTSEDKALGQAMWTNELEKRLERLLPSNVVFIDNPFRPGYRAIVRRHGMNSFDTICPYERGYIPEHSVIRVKTEEVPDPDVMTNRTRISRADLPKYEYRKGEGFVFEENSERPGFKKVKKLWGEKKRGWRTVLLHLVQHQILSPAVVEQHFGADVTPQWAKNLGKQNVVTLY